MSQMYFEDDLVSGEDSLPGACAGSARRIIRKPGHRFMCCIDGSDASEIAYKLVKHMMKPSDTLTMFHAYKPDRHALSEYDPEDIKLKYKNQLIGDIQPSRRFSLEWREREKGQSVFSAVQGHLKRDPDSSPDFLVFGQTGRKGIKQDQPTSLGSNADLAVRSLHIPCIIAKKHLHSDPRHYIYTANSSLSSKCGFDILLQLVRSCDTLTVVYVVDFTEVSKFNGETRNSPSQEQMDEMRAYYDEELYKYGPRQCSFVISYVAENRSVAEHIAEYVNEKNPDFLALAPRAKDDLSPTTDYLIGHVRASIILCKN
jgi:hypothetical protein